MTANLQTAVHPPRLNPFVLPANTHSRFALLIISILGASLLIYQSLYNAMSRAEFQRLVLQCGLDKTCFEPYEQRQALWMVGGVCVLMGISGIIYWVTPRFLIQRWHLTPLRVEDAPDLFDELMKLCQVASLSHQPEFMMEALNPVSRGLTFGHFGRYFILLSGGLVTQFYTDRPIFRAVVLHELAHIENRDIDETYLAVASWYAFLFTVFVPFMINLVIELLRLGLGELGFILGIAWRGIALATLVLLLRNAVLRTREFFADLQASIWHDSTESLSRALASISYPQSVWQTIWQAHPPPPERQLALIETHRLLRMGLGEAIAAGIAVAVAYENTKAWLMLLLPAPKESSAFLGATLLFAPFVIGVMGLGVWRITFTELMRHQSPRGIGHLGLGFGLGLLLGQIVGFRAALGFPLGSASFIGLLLFWFLNILWGILLLASLFLFLKWMAESASVWIQVATSHRSLRYITLFALIIAAGLFTLLLGSLFYVKDILEVFVSALLTNPMNVILRISNSPFTVIFVITLWGFPLAAWFWRRRIKATLEWAFLDAVPPQLVIPDQHLLRPELGIRFGLIGGLLFCVLMSILLFMFHLGLSDSVRGTTEAKAIFLKGEFALAILIQLIVAIVMVIRVRQIGWAHGLFAAFVASLVITIGALGLLQLGYCVNLFSFGPGHTCADRIDGGLTLFFSQHIINLGLIVVWPVALAVASLVHWIRNTSSAQRISIHKDAHA